MIEHCAVSLLNCTFTTVQKVLKEEVVADVSLFKSNRRQVDLISASVPPPPTHPCMVQRKHWAEESRKILQWRSSWCWLHPLQLSHLSPPSRRSPSPPRGSQRQQPCSPQGAPSAQIRSIQKHKKTIHQGQRGESWSRPNPVRWWCRLFEVHQSIFSPSVNFSCFCIPCIRTNTSYTDQEIRRCFREFLKDCPGGTLTRDQVLLIYVFVLVYTYMYLCICNFVLSRDQALLKYQTKVETMMTSLLPKMPDHGATIAGIVFSAFDEVCRCWDEIFDLIWKCEY